MDVNELYEKLGKIIESGKGNYIVTTQTGTSSYGITSVEIKDGYVSTEIKDGYIKIK